MSQQKLISITNEIEFFEEQLNGLLEFLSKNGFESIAVVPVATNLNGAENAKTLTLNITQGISIFRDLESIWKLFRLFRKEKPLIVHTYNSKTGVVGMIAARLAKVPIRLHTMQGINLLDKKGFNRRIYNTLEKWACACATKVYALSDGWKNFIVEHKFSKSEKVDVIGEGGIYGIDIDYYSQERISGEEKKQLKDKLGLTDEDFVFLYVGALSPQKGIEELIMAFEDMKYTVLGKKPNVRLLLIGSTSSDIKELSPKVRKILKEEKRIIKIDFPEDLRPYFAIADCLVYPSHREGFPIIVMQAGAMGLVSIVADTNGSNEIIDQRINGMIVPTGDVEELTIAMTRLKVYDDYSKQMCENARFMVEKRYEKSLVWKTILNEYKNLMETD